MWLWLLLRVEGVVVVDCVVCSLLYVLVVVDVVEVVSGCRLLIIDSWLVVGRLLLVVVSSRVLCALCYCVCVLFFQLAF